MTEETAHQIFQTPAEHGATAHDIYHHEEGENEDGVKEEADGVSGEVSGDFDEQEFMNYVIKLVI